MLGTARRGAARSAIAFVGALAIGCTWVKLSEGGEAVRVAKAGELESCVAKGRTHAQTTDRVLIFARREQPIELELESLARNEAALMGGDAISPAGPIEGGRQTFDVYDCSK